MKLLNYIGIILMAIGLFMGSYYAVEWYKGRSSAGQLTAEEIKSLKNIQDTQLSHETPVTSQVPSSQTEHKEGEKGSDVKHTENKEEVFYILGSR